ncbi:MAG TPA: ORF6N domain-containing protein [Thermoanaerobaculia bacterium]|nr:ORF6N domain-containing protein [Thermoanaerobaculia bacterium]
MVRGQRVILDRDIAELYEVPTKALIQAVKRNVASSRLHVSAFNARVCGVAGAQRLTRRSLAAGSTSSSNGPMASSKACSMPFAP